MLNDNTQISKYTLESILVHFSATIKRLTILCVIEAIISLGIVAGFIWYISLPVDEYSEAQQTVEDIQDSEIHQNIGDSYGESKSKGN
jgi:hypothetical protein